MNRIRQFGNVFEGTFSNKYHVMYYGTIVKMRYSNFKHDPAPLILVLYSGVKYTHALNLNYLSIQEKQYIGRLLYSLKMGKQVIDGRVLYRLLKRDVYNSIIRKCYRTYFSNMILQPKMVSAGFTPLERNEFPFGDPFIINLNKYLSKGNINYVNTKVSYYPEELRDRIILSMNSVPVGRTSESAISNNNNQNQTASVTNTTTIGTQSATVGTTSATK